MCVCVCVSLVSQQAFGARSSPSDKSVFTDGLSGSERLEPDVLNPMRWQSRTPSQRSLQAPVLPDCVSQKKTLWLFGPPVLLDLSNNL